MSENAAQSGSSFDFLAGGGECGELMRQRDWSQTPLGPPDGWPLSLRTCLRIILTSRQPMFVWWGDALINLYNDAYKSIVRGKHPWALGAPAAEVWREIWDEIRPRAQSAMLSNEGTYDEALLLIMERNGYPEETYYTFSYSPVPNDEGGTGGIICANTDDTLRIIGERQVALLRAVAAQTGDARAIGDACRSAAESLTADPHDLPFALIYLVEPERSSAVLAGSAGFAGSHPAVLPRVALDDASVWPLGEVVETHREVLIRDLSRFENLPTGAWERPPHQAVALPIAPSGGAGRAGILVVGLNPYRLYDENYRRFLELLASQISAAIANAQAYEDERDRAEALTELDRAKTAFFSNVSHEFRTPLTLMLGPMEELLAKAESGELSEEREQLAVMYRNGRRLLRLVNTLLDFSRIEAGRVQASYEPLDLAAYTADLASVFRSAIEKAGLRLIIDAPPLAGQVYVDREMWEKIVLNLVSNAFKYTLEGEIEVSLRATPGRALLQVRDTGIGIPESELPRLFDRFHRVQGAQGRTHEGTGIGLALVQELAKLHGGTVDVESRAGQGTTFTVSIPLGREHLPVDRIQAPRTMVSTSSGARSYLDEALRWLPDGNTTADAELQAADSSEDRECILLADDNADMRGYVERLLKNEYEVMTAPDGVQALRLAREKHPDLILTDVMMPNLDGFGLLEALRQDHRTASIPVIMLSARAGEEARVEGLSAGADDYLVKPFSARELYARVSGLLSLSRARHEAAETLREIFERAPTIFAVLRGPQHIFEVVNPKYAELIGGNRDVIGKPIREALPELGSQVFIDLLDHVYETGEPFVGTEAHVRLQRGNALEDAYVDFVYEPLRTRNGVINGVFAHGVDVTAKVRARVELERANAALRDQAQLTRAITDNVTSALLMLDEEGHPTFLNPAFEAMTGFTLDEVAGRPIHETLHHHRADGRPFPIAECPIMAAATQMVALQDHRDQFFRKDGSMFPVACSLMPLSGERRMAVVEIRDVTIEQQAAEAMKEDARRKDEFIATLSHELRTPLTAILGWTSMLKLGLDAQTQKTALQTIEQSGRMQAELIDDILDISRITAGKMRIEPQSVNVADVCVAAVEGVRLAAAAKELQLELDLRSESAPLILGDPNRLQQIIWNLLTNAIKFTPAGGRVTLRVELSGRDVIVSVTDTGIGIDPSFLPHVFELFRQAELSATRMHGGLGLGLSIVRHLVEAHGGRITVESPGIGRGATFTVVFPRLGATAPASAPLNTTKLHADVAPAEAASLHGVEVLIIDDHASVRDYFTAALQHSGARIRTAESVRDAVVQITDKPPQVVVCDLAMPDEDGFSFIAWLRAQALPRVPVIAITALGRPDDRQRALRAGFDDFLSKPVSPEELSGAVARNVARV